MNKIEKGREGSGSQCSPAAGHEHARKRGCGLRARGGGLPAATGEDDGGVDAGMKMGDKVDGVLPALSSSAIVVGGGERAHTLQAASAAILLPPSMPPYTSSPPPYDASSPPLHTSTSSPSCPPPSAPPPSSTHRSPPPAFFLPLEFSSRRGDSTLPSKRFTMSATYDREAEHRALNATLSGVHGLVASGVTAVPSIFRVPDPEPPPPPPSSSQESPPLPPSIPGGSGRDHPARRGGVGIPLGDGPRRTGGGGRRRGRGSEGSDKARLYSRDPARAAKYSCNFDLYQSPAANWRDMLYLRMAPDPPPAGDLPEYCRDDLKGRHLSPAGSEAVDGPELIALPHINAQLLMLGLLHPRWLATYHLSGNRPMDGYELGTSTHGGDKADTVEEVKWAGAGWINGRNFDWSRHLWEARLRMEGTRGGTTGFSLPSPHRSNKERRHEGSLSMFGTKQGG
uniref:Uncharacterized protein n=1 Tax=Oryza glumipatula TaxID=40148 RepID=A0A0E0BUN9_9ORYZ